MINDKARLERVVVGFFWTCIQFGTVQNVFGDNFLEGGQESWTAVLEPADVDASHLGPVFKVRFKMLTEQGKQHASAR